MTDVTSLITKHISLFTANSWMYILNMVLLICQISVHVTGHCDRSVCMASFSSRLCSLRSSVCGIVNLSIVNLSGSEASGVFSEMFFFCHPFCEASVCINGPASSSSSSSVFRICAIRSVVLSFCISPNGSSMDVIDVVFYTNIYTSKNGIILKIKQA